jgi:hypothetical protein
MLKNPFAPPSALELASRELAEHKRHHLTMLSAKEYAAQMSEYHANCIERLEAYLREQTK